MPGFVSRVNAEEPLCVGAFCATEECPELKSLKNSAATIGGNAWNTILGWIYHQWPADDLSSQFRVKKLPEKIVGTDILQTGAEIYGWSSYNRLACKAQREAGTPYNCPSICWGKTCSKEDSDKFGWNNDSENFCTKPITSRCMLPPWDDYPLDKTDKLVEKGAYAELDYKNPDRMYEVIQPDKTKKMMTPLQVETEHIAKNKRTLKCRYPVNGWLKIRQLKEYGWVKLSGRINSTSVPIPTKGVDPGVDYAAWPKENCITNPDAEVCRYQVMYDPAQKEFIGWAWSPRVRWISFSGSTIYSTGSDWHNTFICGASCTTISFEQTSPLTDPKKGRSRWNSSFIGVWVQALGGNIFAKKGFTGVAPPPGEKNTPYLIVTGRYTEGEDKKVGGIVSWESECDDRANPLCGRVGKELKDKTRPEEQSPFLDLALPRASGLANRSFIKRSMLGTIDTSGFIPASDALVPQKNAKGNVVRRIADESTLWIAATSSGDGLGNTIYYVDGDLVLGDTDTDKKIIQNAMSNPTGAGTVVVRGNLLIKRPFEYGIGSVKNLNQLASISWVVLKRKDPASSLPPNKPADISDADWKAGGNISIDSCLPSNNGASLNDVTIGKQLARIVGTFFAENTIATGTGHGEAGSGKCANLGNQFTTTSRIYPERGDTCAGDLHTESNECTITQTQYYDVPLEIEGVLVARNILFQRVYRGRNRGSEVIVNTGRMLVNPPPGLAEFSKSLPSW